MGKTDKRHTKRRKYGFLTVKDIYESSMNSNSKKAKEIKEPYASIFVIEEIEISLHHEVYKGIKSDLISLVSSKQKKIDTTKMAIINDDNFAAFIESKNHALAEKIKQQE